MKGNEASTFTKYDCCIMVVILWFLKPYVLLYFQHCTLATFDFYASRKVFATKLIGNIQW